MELSDDAKHYWPWIAQREYKFILECYSHIDDEEDRIEIESALIERLNEYNIKIMGRSLDQQIKLNKRAKMCDLNLPDPSSRYPDLFR